MVGTVLSAREGKTEGAVVGNKEGEREGVAVGAWEIKGVFVGANEGAVIKALLHTE